MIRAAGILILDKKGLALFLKRGPGGDMPGLWCVPGGRIEDGEEPVDAAVRECFEEAGYEADRKALTLWTRRVSPRETTGATPTPPPTNIVAPPPNIAPLPPPPASGAVVALGDQVDFTTFILKGVDNFVPVLGPVDSPEHVAYAWAPVDQPPEPLHPGVGIALARCSMHETDVAKAMAAGELTSPQVYDNMMLFDLRVTGTGMSFRHKFNEHVWRDEKFYLTQDFLDRCNGLPVILEHPTTSILNSKEFKKRVIGTVVVPYIKGTEVWGVAKIFDASAARMMMEDQLSTSPAVVWRDPDSNSKFEMEDGSKFLIEGKPSLLDHLAICERGVWDKGKDPTGVNTTTTETIDETRGDSDMKLQKIEGETDEGYARRCDEMEKMLATARADAAGGETLDKVLKGIDAVKTALDSASKRLDSIEEERKADKARRDAEEGDEEGKKKADARRRADAFQFSKRKDEDEDDDFEKRHDAEEKDCADAEMEAGEPEPVALDKAKRRRKDAEEEDEKERADASRRRDSRSDSDVVAALRVELDDLKARLPIQMTDDDHSAFAAIQARADSTYMLLGKEASRAMQGESKLAYRRRLLEGLQVHTAYKDVDLGVIAVDSAAFDVIEGQILTQAANMARSPASVPEGELRQVVRQSNGHTITDFLGDPKAWMSANQPVGQAVTAFPPRK